MQAQQRFDINVISRLLRRFLRLNIENMRLSLTERLTILMSAVAFFFIALLLCTIGFIFITAGIGHLLEGCMDIKWVYLIIGGIYFSIVLLLWLFRKKILVDPICRFLSRLIVEPPQAKRPAN